MTEKDMKTIIALAKRRGFIYPGSSLYGGLESTYDYGPMGVQMKMNIKRLWWKHIVERRADVVGLDSSIFQHPRVWEASGHVSGFHDPLVECRQCHKRHRADKLDDEHRKNNRCPACGGELMAEQQFNLMFKTTWGPVSRDDNNVYLRPETAQGIFINYKNVRDTMRVEPPFGIAQIGKAFRNEITVGNFVFRMREFEQMEMEYFTPAEQAERWFDEWREIRLQWYIDLGIAKENLRLRDHENDELAHYAKAATDVEYNFPFGFDEIEGIANRQNFDLKQHREYSGEKIDDPLPHVIEPSAGVDRLFMAFLIDAYNEEQVGDDKRTVLKLHPDIAPYQVAVFPLMKNKPELVKKAQEVAERLRMTHRVFYDEKGSVGKRYRRMDEVGTPRCITIDFDTIGEGENLSLKDTVTVRDRDTMEQQRVKISELVDN